jgi:hypothetical protein
MAACRRSRNADRASVAAQERMQAGRRWAPRREMTGVAGEAD